MTGLPPDSDDSVSSSPEGDSQDDRWSVDRGAQQQSSPFEAPDAHRLPPRTTDPSVFEEPWMQSTLHPSDISDPGPVMPAAADVLPDQSVWDEPGLSRPLAGATPETAVTWYRWFERQRSSTSAARTWLVTILVAALGGFLAILGTLASQSIFGSTLVAVTILGPTTEEVMKMALPLWLVEKRPWLYHNMGQILICALASGAAFAAVENVVYLKLYVPNPPASLVAWRWTVCVILHSGCSTLAGVGVVRIWQRFQQNRRAPALADGARWIVAAIVVHGLYNGSVTMLELSGLEF